MKKNAKPIIIWSFLGIVSVICLYLVIILSFWFVSKDRVYPGVTVAGISLSGKTKAEAESLLKGKTDAWMNGKIDFSSQASSLCPPSDLGLQFDLSKSADNALSIGGRNPFSLGFPKHLSLATNIDAGKTSAKLSEFAKAETKTVINSKVEKKGEVITVIDGTPGRQLNYAETTSRLLLAAGNLENRVNLSFSSVPPTFSGTDLEKIMPEVTEKSKDPLTLSGGVVSFTVSPEVIVSWVQLAQPKKVYARQFSADSFFDPIFTTSSGSIFSNSLISNYLLTLSGKINQTPVNAELNIQGGRASVFVPSRDGKTLDVEKSATDIIAALDGGEKTVSLTVIISKPEVNEGSLNDLGIAELLSTGMSNFAGSPTNRRHNIKVGAARFNGVLIKPGEDFSFNTTLGEVDASTGYLPELVIKENKTIPEYGGGMCQVSSTAFRAALNAGLPILARTAHSYPVSYYKPYGVDATVYLPKPDLIFKNDTGKYILIQTRIVGNNLYFDFYGTKLPRSVKFGGSANGAGAVYPVESVTPYLYDQGIRGNGSFSAIIYRFNYDATGKLVDTDKFTSKYDSPDKYPH